MIIMKKLTFTAFSDMHYRVGMYSTTVKDLMTVIGRAKESGSQFMIHCGDMCNNYVESPERSATELLLITIKTLKMISA